MSASINWARLLSQDRCKDIGVPWTEEEGLAIHRLDIPAEYVRAGIRTKKTYRKVKEEEEATGEKEIRFMSRSELVAILGEYEAELSILAETPTSVVREAVEVAIRKGAKKKTKVEDEDNEEEEEDEDTIEDVDEDIEEEIEEKKPKVNTSNSSRGRKRSRS